MDKYTFRSREISQVTSAELREITDKDKDGMESAMRLAWEDLIDAKRAMKKLKKIEIFPKNLNELRILALENKFSEKELDDAAMRTYCSQNRLELVD